MMITLFLAFAKGEWYEKPYKSWLCKFRDTIRCERKQDVLKEKNPIETKG